MFVIGSYHVSLKESSRYDLARVELWQEENTHECVLERVVACGLLGTEGFDCNDKRETLDFMCGF